MLVRRVVGDSMAPTLKPGAIVVTKPFARYQKGDVVIIEHDGLEKVKRIQRINENVVFITGDNPAASTDSMEFGWIDTNMIRGRVIWPRNL